MSNDITLPPRWYMISKSGAAMICVDEADAWREAARADHAWPDDAPHTAAQLAPVQIEVDQRERGEVVGYVSREPTLAHMRKATLPEGTPLYTAPPASRTAPIIERLRNPLTPFGLVVRALRIVSDSSLLEMSYQMSLTAAHLSGVETGRKPLTENIIRAAHGFFVYKGLDVSIDLLRTAARASERK